MADRPGDDKAEAAAKQASPDARAVTSDVEDRKAAAPINLIAPVPTPSIADGDNPALPSADSTDGDNNSEQEADFYKYWVRHRVAASPDLIMFGQLLEYIGGPRRFPWTASQMKRENIVAALIAAEQAKRPSVAVPSLSGFRNFSRSFALQANSVHASSSQDFLPNTSTSHRSRIAAAESTADLQLSAVIKATTTPLHNTQPGSVTDRDGHPLAHVNMENGAIRSDIPQEAYRPAGPAAAVARELNADLPPSHDEPESTLVYRESNAVDIERVLREKSD